MKTLIIEIDNETRAIAHELNRLKCITEERKACSMSEEKLKVLLKERLSRIIDATAAMQELVNGVKGMDGGSQENDEL